MNPLAHAELEENKSIVDQDMASGYGTDLHKRRSQLMKTCSSAICRESVNNHRKFQVKENAVNQVDDLNSQGYNAEIIVAQNGYFRVSAMRYSNREMAEATRTNLLSKYPGTWILKN